jgi:hypothetical protein
LAKYALFGGFAGLALGMGALIVTAILYGNGIGLSPQDCAVFACTMTMFLSQPVGIGGLVAGTAVGLMSGGVVYYAHHHGPRAA